LFLNLSRAQTFLDCRRKVYNWSELRLLPLREADALIDGGAYHKGAAAFIATGDLNHALSVAEQEQRVRNEGQIVLPEEQALVEKSVAFVQRAITAFAEYYQSAGFRVLMPEVKFCIPMPNTAHHCWFAHRLLHPETPYQECFQTYGANTKCQNLPHYFIGRADGVVSWKDLIWLLEQKTSSITGQIFFDRFVLDWQPTGYLYGLNKALGVKAHGFILLVIKKPTKNAKDQETIYIEPEPFTRTDADLARFEQNFVQIANDYEQAAVNNTWYMNTHACTNWNRRCYYWDQCKRNNEPVEGEFRTRDNDYVDEEFRKLLGLDTTADQISPAQEFDTRPA